MEDKKTKDLEEKVASLEEENTRLREDLARLKPKKRLTTREVEIPVEHETKRRPSAIVTTNAPGDHKAMELQISRLKLKTPEERQDEILDKVRKMRAKKGVK